MNDPRRAAPGRNDPCSCGSGRKFKHCCGALTSPALRSRTVAEALQLGVQHQAKGRIPEAEAAFRRVLGLQPDNAQAVHHLGWIAHLSGDNRRAVELLRKSTALAPDEWVAHYNLGRVLRGEGRFAEAGTCFERAALLQPRFAPVLNDLGSLRFRQGLTEDAMRWAELAVAAAPDYELACSNHLHFSHYLPGVDVAALFEEHRRYGKRIAPPIMLGPAPERVPGARIRVGYVSGDFRHHAVAWFLEPVLELHDRSRFEIFCYSNNESDDAITQRLRAHAEHWREISRVSDAAAAQMVRADAVDILVDLAGHTYQNRLAIFAARPARVQVSWLGYFNTTGMEAIDFLVTDPVSSPTGDAQPFVETLVRLPRARLCYKAPSYAPAPAPLPAASRGFITFGTFNKPAKINAAVISVWARIMHRIPSSRMLLKGAGFTEVEPRERMLRLFAECGIGEDRLELRGLSVHRRMLEEYAEVDIALDPFPFSGGATTCEALWQGVPVLTLRGNTLLSRQSASLITAAGMTDWIAESVDDYAARAIAFAGDVAALAALRAHLRERTAASRLCDARTFARDFEWQLERMLPRTPA